MSQDDAARFIRECAEDDRRLGSPRVASTAEIIYRWLTTDPYVSPMVRLELAAAVRAIGLVAAVEAYDSVNPAR